MRRPSGSSGLLKPSAPTARAQARRHRDRPRPRAPDSLQPRRDAAAGGRRAGAGRVVRAVGLTIVRPAARQKAIERAGFQASCPCERMPNPVGGRTRSALRSG
jgi:hypothetical protein